MKSKVKWTSMIFIIGIIALIIGAFDPLEGSIIIAAGSILITLSTFYTHDRHHKLFLTSAIMIIFGVCCMFYISYLGGYDPKREWWWNVLILPYPVGWLISVIILIYRAIGKLKKQPIA